MKSTKGEELIVLLSSDLSRIYNILSRFPLRDVITIDSLSQDVRYGAINTYKNHSLTLTVANTGGLSDRSEESTFRPAKRLPHLFHGLGFFIQAGETVVYPFINIIKVSPVKLHIGDC